ncbi:hypothetical protein PY254_16475 [Rhodanobacter sp. AS-Z3]|uniref:hypothetical protein n=1 Tax=Rhodanobacter sp. AS-Z3 TaxID=3031330 RepID=UPI00247ADA52|nr:hypothetical protein [Rhodanobacter sp. AS-Z3]WEN14806.1 hypothetical protein PY254_16475 [Rhodanobacter sp. AS-Z3]
MHGKWVKLDKANAWRFREVDTCRLLREARHVCHLIERGVPPNDTFGIHDELLPLLVRVIAGDQGLPLDSQFEPGALRWATHEGTLPDSYREFLRAQANFFVTATGSHREEPVEEWIDGERHAWMEFEDADDGEPS